MKDKTIACLIALFLGSLGIHRFYLGQYGLGIVYILFSWTGIPFFISLADGIIFLTMDYRDFDMKYNGGEVSGDSSIFHQPPPVREVSHEIEHLFDLKEKGVLTEDEFQYRKEILLNQ